MIFSLLADWPLEWPLFELTPSRNQIVFPGDRLPLECRASVTDSESSMLWVREQAVLSNETDTRYYVLETYVEDGKIAVHRLVIEKVQTEDSGVWRCLIQTPEGNVSKSVNVVVISDETVYCPAEMKQDERGMFRWPKTVRGIHMDLPCPYGGVVGGTGRAYYRCTDAGVWKNMNTTQCHYEREVTRVLQQYCKVKST